LGATSIPSLDHAAMPLTARLQAWSRWFVQPAVLIRVVLYLTTLVYIRTALFDYVYDDTVLITLNPGMESWKLIPSFFTHSFWSFLEIPRVIDFYRPLVMVALAVIRHLLGPAPGWFHLVAAGMHILATYLVYRFACETVGNKTVAAVAAGIFGLHPTKVETAAWISGISDSLSAVLFLASMIAYFKWRRENRHDRRILFVSAVLLLFALFSKEAAIFAPILIAIYELAATKAGLRDRCLNTLRSVWPFAATTAIVLITRILLVRNPGGQVVNPVDPVQTLLTSPKVILWYLGKQLWPVNLSVHYPIISVTHFSLIGFVVPLLVLTVLCAIAAYSIRNSPVAIFLVGWFALMIAPAILYQATLQMHDRYFYFASVATSIGLAYLIVRFANGRAIMQTAMVLVLFGAMTALTFDYESYWDNDTALFSRAFQIAPDNPNAAKYLAEQYVNLGQPENGEAVARAVINNQELADEGWYILGTVFLSEKKYEQAREALQESLRLSEVQRLPSSIALATADFRLGRYDEAAQIYRDQITRHPDMAFLHGSLAAVLRVIGKTDEAARELELQRRSQ
jgi:protein O-mannosyl-transferase